jgi:hypothetical protein
MTDDPPGSGDDRGEQPEHEAAGEVAMITKGPG